MRSISLPTTWQVTPCLVCRFIIILGGKMVDLQKFPTNQVAKEMLSYVTKGWYDKSYVGKWLYQVMGLSMDEVKGLYEEFPAQLFVDTATWGLSYHEQKYGLPIRAELPYEERRKLIRQCRGSRVPITPYNLEHMLSQQLGLQAEVADVHDPGSENYGTDHPNIFQVTIREKNQNTIINYEEIEEAIDKVKQPHTIYKTIHRQEFHKAQPIYIGAAVSGLVIYDVKPRLVSRDVERGVTLGATALIDSFVLQEVPAERTG